MAKNLDIPLLYDFYGELLTDKQRNMIELYYHQDLSLSEIAENIGISRQGVRDSVKRAEAQLVEMEAQLGMAARLKRINTGLADILHAAQALLDDNAVSGSVTVHDQATRIVNLATALTEH